MSPKTAYAAFHAYSKGIATNFLQSVVVVDDKAETSFETKSDIINQQQGVQLLKPGRAPRKTFTADTGDPVSSVNASTEDLAASTTSRLEAISLTPQPQDSEILPIKALNEAFAQYGIVCGFLSPSATGSDRGTIIKAVEKAAKRADIVILDWKMEGKEEGTPDGYTALKIIEHILKSDEKGGNNFQSSGRLRLIAIYSQSPDLTAIIDTINHYLSTVSNPKHSFDRIDEFTLKHESTRICAFRKSGGTINDARTFNVNSLTSKLIEEFTFLTEGLLSNVAIEALSALRLNTHKILQKFKPDLDASYITHRALTNPSDETQAHPVAMLASEMQDVLEGNNITGSVSPELIKLWIESLPERGINIKSDFRTISDGQLIQFLIEVAENGVSSVVKFPTENIEWNKYLKGLKSPAKDEHSRFTNFMLNDSTGSSRDREFSMLTTVRSHYSVPPPFLNLGTIIAIRNSGLTNYYVCIQPVCDCVRLECATRFPFLKLEIPAKPDPEKPKPPKFDFIIKDGDKLLELKVDYKAYNMELFSFAPKNKLIEANEVDIPESSGKKEWVFSGKNDAGTPIQCVWLADLKFAHAQRIAGRFGGEITRVGLTESEWLRRMAS